MDIKVNPGKTEEEYFEILRDRIIECICNELLSKNITTFHGVDMVRHCAQGFLNEMGANQYEFSGEHEYYRHVLERIYRPLVDLGLIDEYENNNYGIPEKSRLRNICKEELGPKSYIKWQEFLQKARFY